MLLIGTSTWTIICYPKRAVECIFLGCANPMDIPRSNSIICLPCSLCLFFLYGIEVWGAAYQRKYLDRMDRFLKRAHRFGFVTKNITILDLTKDRDSKLFKNVIRDYHILHDLLPPKRKQVLHERKHDFIKLFPRVRTECFKRSFPYRCIFY